MSVGRSSVLLVYGTGLNTRPSPSVMRPVKLYKNRHRRHELANLHIYFVYFYRLHTKLAQVGRFPTTVSDGAGKYRLTVSGYSGDAGDAMAGEFAVRENSNANGAMFSTPDRDNDLLDGPCSTKFGWWFAACSESSLSIEPRGKWVTTAVTTPELRRDVEVSHMLLKLN